MTSKPSGATAWTASPAPPNSGRPILLRRSMAAGVQSGSNLSKGLPDNRCPYTLFQKMTDTEQQAVPHGFTQITEGRIRATDIIFGESGRWAIPHVFLVGGDIADDGRSIARPHVKKPGGRS
jgi:hypothetical protein